MLRILILTHSETTFKALGDRFATRPGCGVIWSPSLYDATQQIKSAAPQLVVIDEKLDGITGLEAARVLVLVDAMVSIAVVSTLTPEAFHHTSEGLGILAQLPPNPSASQVEGVLKSLQTVSV